MVCRDMVIISTFCYKILRNRINYMITHVLYYYEKNVFSIKTIVNRGEIKHMKLKKAIIVLLMVTLLVSICGCGNHKEKVFVCPVNHTELGNEDFFSYFDQDVAKKWNDDEVAGFCIEHVDDIATNMGITLVAEIEKGDWKTCRKVLLADLGYIQGWSYEEKRVIEPELKTGNKEETVVDNVVDTNALDIPDTISSIPDDPSSDAGIIVEEQYEPVTDFGKKMQEKVTPYFTGTQEMAVEDYIEDYLYYFLPSIDMLENMTLEEFVDYCCLRFYYSDGKYVVFPEECYEMAWKQIKDEFIEGQKEIYEETSYEDLIEIARNMSD